MVILRKIAASTLMETMVATVLLVIVFMTASMVMGSLLEARFKSETGEVNAALREIRYQLQSGNTQLPYSSNPKGWTIRMNTKSVFGTKYKEIRATHPIKEKTVTSIVIDKK